MSPHDHILFPDGLFVPSNAFIVNAFERRFQGTVRYAWEHHSWHVIAALSESGKSSGIAEIVVDTGAVKRRDGTTSRPVISIRSPKNRKAENALGLALASSLGVVPRLPWDVMRTWLVSELARVGLECLVIDDAHDLSLDHLRYLKELTDNLLAPPYNRRIGLCLVAASVGDRIPLQETFNRPESIWVQFRSRLDGQKPYRLVHGHNQQEVVELCAGYEDAYRDQFPDLHLVPWGASIYQWLTHPALDSARTGRVTMGSMKKFVNGALATAAALGRSDVDGDLLRATADVLTLGHAVIDDVDGEPDAYREDNVDIQEESRHADAG